MRANSASSLDAPYGRVRLYEHTSDLVLRLLFEERDRLLIERKGKDEKAIRLFYNQQVAQVDQVIDEVRRMRSEKGWSLHYTPWSEITPWTPSSS